MATKKAATKTARSAGSKGATKAKPAPRGAKAPAKKAKVAPKKAAPKKAAPKVAKKAAPKKAAPKKAVRSVAAKKAVPQKAMKPSRPVVKPAPKKASSVAKKTINAPVKKQAAVPAKPAAKAPAPAQKPVVASAPPQPVAKPVTQPIVRKEPPKPTKIIIPKTSTNKAVKYEPDFTRSVLDTNQAEQAGPSMRYSDAELQEFRELINRKLETAKKELAYLQGLITRKDEGGDLDEGRYMTMEDGSMSMEREQLSQMASRQIQFIDHLEKALMRIENKTYGVCRVTGKLIDKARLRAVPHATLSIEAKQLMNK
jgi:RNA polymerase-binding transcription factor DksA